MPHLRKRYVEPLIRRGLTFKGIVGLFGHRQVGKTTLLEQLTKRYTTLDLSRERERSEADPEGFLEELARDPRSWPVGLDECQMSPPLFPALKDYVRKNKRPGIFLLSGSVRFTSRKAIRESLTGRLLTYEVLPFSISEIKMRPINTLARDLMTADFRSLRLAPVASGEISDAQRYLETGGLPGVCFVRNERERAELLDSQLDLILDRDLRLVCETNLSLRTLRSVVKVLAKLQNEPINFSVLRRQTQISEPTLKKLLAGLEAIFFLREVPCRGGEKRNVFFFEDQGEARYLSEGKTDSYGDLIRLAYAHLRVPFAYEPGVQTELFQYRTLGGAYVPLVFTRREKTIGFIGLLEDRPTLSAIRSAQSLKIAHPGAKIVYLHPGKAVTILNSDEAAIPVVRFC